MIGDPEFEARCYRVAVGVIVTLFIVGVSLIIGSLAFLP